MNKSKNLAKSGILTALTLIILYIANIAPTSKLTLLTLASAIIPLGILSINVRYALGIYLASSILSLILGLKGVSITYILFFGIYGFIKYYIENLRKAPLEILVKLTFFNISLFINVYVFKFIFTSIPYIDLPYALIIIIIEISFIIFDYALTLIIIFMDKYIHRLK
ncbi:hypothetical protein KQI89_13930 [Clostridium sp. MSJ-4]|uniref:Uncharacterized protein n=1 Tax=Clostridium simiarum TaxID=2841506 RepID=A0ABS6F3L6_9CLOT|nr:hypothetical protein [Clostridium simiarum]MBU5592848.1 hypothetical protein [Clostridium simiarum]